jgi:hypothetical protein
MATTDEQMNNMEAGTADLNIDSTEISRELAQRAVRSVLGKDNSYLQRLLERRLELKETNKKVIPLTKIIKPADRNEIKKTLSTEVVDTQQQAIEILRNTVATDGEKHRRLSVYTEQHQKELKQLKELLEQEEIKKQLELQKKQETNIHKTEKYQLKLQHELLTIEQQNEKKQLALQEEIKKIELQKQQEMLKLQELKEKQNNTQPEVVENSPLLPDANSQQALSSWVLNTVLQEKLKDHEVGDNSKYWKYINGSLALILPLATGLIQYFLTGKMDCNCPSE